MRVLVKSRRVVGVSDTLFNFEGTWKEFAPLAQLVEQLTLNQRVPGSSP